MRACVRARAHVRSLLGSSPSQNLTVLAGNLVGRFLKLVFALFLRGGFAEIRGESGFCPQRVQSLAEIKGDSGAMASVVEITGNLTSMSD